MRRRARRWFCRLDLSARGGRERRVRIGWGIFALGIRRLVLWEGGGGRGKGGGGGGNRFGGGGGKGGGWGVQRGGGGAGGVDGGVGIFETEAMSKAGDFFETAKERK